MPNAILALNAGSSSIKFALFEVSQDGLKLLSTGQVEGIGTAPHFVARIARETAALVASTGLCSPRGSASARLTSAPWSASGYVS